MWYNYTYGEMGRLKQVRINNAECVSFTYEKAGNFLNRAAFTKTVTLPNGEAIITKTDSRDRLDSLRHQKTGTDANGAEETVETVLKSGFEYDVLNRCTQYTDGAANLTHKLTYSDAEDCHEVLRSEAPVVRSVLQKNKRGKVLSNTYTFGSTAERAYTFDYEDTLSERLASVTVGNIVQTYGYDKLGRKASEVTATGAHTLSRTVHYLKHGDHTTQLIAAERFENGALTKYSYNAAGHVECVRENGVLTARYTYDKLSRLVREDNKALGVTTTFLYDNGGNLLLQRKYNYSLEDEEELTLQNELVYAYGNADRSDQLTSFNGEAIVYNANGMPTTYRGNTCTYTRGTLLTSFDGHTFAYDADGLRTQKDNVDYTYLDGKLLRETNNANCTIDYIYGADGMLGICHNGTTYLFRKNIFGDVTHIYDTEGNLKARYVYDAWGNHKVFNGNGADITDSEDATEIGLINPIRYRGYYYDTEIGLYYLRARYYDPETGRFISQDGISYLDPEHLMGLNLYVYCNDNPIVYYDPSGCLSKRTAWLSSGLLIVGGVVLSVAAAGIATSGIVAIVATIGGIVGGGAIGAGAASLIGAYINEASGGTFEAGYVGGLISGFFTGVGAGIGGWALATASLTGNWACVAYLGVSVMSSFSGAALGDFLGNYVTSKKDNTQFDKSLALQSALLAGGLNVLAGLGSAMASIVGAVAGGGATLNTNIAARLLSSSIIVGTEASYDFISYLIRKVIF